jgi:hypothetical protein
MMTYEFPMGKGRHFLNHANRLRDVILGGYNFYWTYTRHWRCGIRRHPIADMTVALRR